MIVQGKKDAEFTLSVRLDIDDIEAMAVREIQSHPIPSMMLIVKKPDYLGSSMWEFRHGRRAVSARIEHEAWLAEFQSRRVDISPGDALRCQVRIEMLYGHDNELIAEKYYVEHVHEVMENQFEQISLLDDSDGD